MAEEVVRQVVGIAGLQMSRAQEMVGRLELPIPTEERQMTTNEIIEKNSHQICGDVPKESIIFLHSNL